MTHLTQPAVISMLRDHLLGKYGTKTRAAIALDVHQSYISDVLGGRKVPSQLLLNQIGVRRERRWTFWQA